MSRIKIDRAWLESHGACSEGKEFFLSEGLLSPAAGVRNLLRKGKFDWANWLVVRLMTHTQKVTYGAYAAKQVLGIFEKAYPTDKRPRLAIEAALRFAKRPTDENRDAAAYAANAAANAAYAAANAAANAAYAAAYAAYAAYAAANAAANAAAYAANAAAKDAMKRKIVLYGLRLLANKGGR